MGTEHLVTYLSDHLAGAAGAIELMAHIERAHPDHPVVPLIGQIKADVEADRDELQLLVGRLEGGGESAPRKAAAWIGERLLLLKLRVDDPADGALRLFEALEVISLGIEGKSTLWQTLAASASGVRALQGMDYDRLIARAQAQRSTLEPARLDAARLAFVEGDAH